MYVNYRKTFSHHFFEKMAKNQRPYWMKRMSWHWKNYFHKLHWMIFTMISMNYFCHHRTLWTMNYKQHYHHHHRHRLPIHRYFRINFFHFSNNQCSKKTSLLIDEMKRKGKKSKSKLWWKKILVNDYYELIG